MLICNIRLHIHSLHTFVHQQSKRCVKSWILLSLLSRTLFGYSRSVEGSYGWGSTSAISGKRRITSRSAYVKSDKNEESEQSQRISIVIVTSDDQSQ